MTTAHLTIDTDDEPVTVDFTVNSPEEQIVIVITHENVTIHTPVEPKVIRS